MTKAAALYQFFSSFGLTAYEENSVYNLDEAPSFPYLTYELNTDSFSDSPITLTFSLWYKTSSLVAINAKAEEISEAIGRGGVMIPCDGGAIWIKRRSPFAQSMGDSTDDRIKRKVINISVEFFTAD